MCLSDHLVNQTADEVLAVTSGTTFIEVKELLLETTGRAVEPERPDEVVCLLEVRANSEDLVDKIFHADDTNRSKHALNDGVIRQSNALLIHFAESTLVHKLADRLHVGVTVRDVRLDQAHHHEGGFVQLHEDSTVDLAQTKELQNFAGLRRDTVDTTDTDNDSELALRLKEKVSMGLGHATVPDKIPLDLAVLLHVLLSAFEHLLALLLVVLPGSNLGSRSLDGELLIALAPLKDGLRNTKQS